MDKERNWFVLLFWLSVVFCCCWIIVSDENCTFVDWLHSIRDHILHLTFLRIGIRLMVLAWCLSCSFICSMHFFLASLICCIRSVIFEILFNFLDFWWKNDEIFFVIVLWLNVLLLWFIWEVDFILPSLFLWLSYLYYN